MRRYETITGLQRTDVNGTANNNFSVYSYTANSDMLASVGNSTTPAAYAAYTYDALGQLKSQSANGTTPAFYPKFDVTGKMAGIYADPTLATLKIAYTYDEAGNRISRTDNTGSGPVTTYFVYDANGNIMAIYTGTTLTEVPVHGGERLGTYTPANNNYVYELRDNLGSVRVVLNRAKVNGLANVAAYDDYFPFGSIAQAGTTGSTYRYDYQGEYAQKDAYTNWNNFELRMYDGKIGRWLSTDPAGQFASPYEGMGNNPVTGSDKDGGDVGNNSGGAVLNDWVQRGDGSVYWDPNAKSQATTQAGETYIGPTAAYVFDSFINPKLWDGLLGDLVTGDKLTSTISVTGHQDANGNLTGFSAAKNIVLHGTLIGFARDYYPGLGDGQNIFYYSNWKNADGSLGFDLGFEQHASVSTSEDIGLGNMSYFIPDVAQKLNIIVNNNNLSVKSYTDTFPSATLSVNGKQIMNFVQPSFTKTFSWGNNPGTPYWGYLPAQWFPR